MKQDYRWVCALSLLLLLGAGCSANQPQVIGMLPTQTASATATASQTSAPTLTPTASQTSTAAPTFTTTASPTPLGCQRPPDDYTRIPIYNGIILNKRTIAML